MPGTRAAPHGNSNDALEQPRPVPGRADRTYLSSQILPDERQPVPGMQGALQGVGEVKHRIVHQHFDMLGEVASVRSPEGLVQLWKPPTQAAQDLADRVAVL